MRAAPAERSSIDEVVTTQVAKEIYSTSFNLISHCSLSRGPPFAESNGIFCTVDFVAGSHSAILTRAVGN